LSSIPVPIIFLHRQPVIKAKDLSVLRISPVGKSISGGVTSDNYAFKTKGDNVIELGIKVILLFLQNKE